MNANTIRTLAFVGLAISTIGGVSSPSWVLDYEEHGFRTPLGALPEESSSLIRSLVAQMEAEGLDMKTQNEHTINPHFNRPEFMAAAADPALLNAVETVLGRDILLVSTTLFSKYPADPSNNSNECLSIIGAHQDRQYWSIAPATSPVLSVWVAVDDVDEENGAMVFYSGTHKSKLQHDTFTDSCSALMEGQSIPKSLLSQTSVRAELRSGQYAIFDSMLAHASGKNRSPRRRTGLTMIFAGGDVSLLPMGYSNEKPDWRKPVLVRGSRENVRTQLFEVSGFTVGPAYRQLEDISKAESDGVNDAMALRASAKPVTARLLSMVESLKGQTLAAQLDLLEHSLQTATRAFNDGADNETVVVALLHDIGELLAPNNHGEVAAAFLRPYISPRNHWLLEHHEIFQAHHYGRGYGLSSDVVNARDAYRLSEHFNATEKFCRDYDQAAFDASYTSLPIAFFEPMLLDVISRTPYFHADHGANSVNAGKMKISGVYRADESTQPSGAVGYDQNKFTQPSWVVGYEQNGFVTPLGALPEESASRIRSLVSEMEAEGVDMKKQNNYTINPHLSRPEFMAAAADPAMLNQVEAIVGPDILLVSTTLFSKYPVDVKKNPGECLSIIGAHQDRQYWNILPVSSPVLSVWIAVDDVDEANGAMVFHGGTHKAELHHDTFTSSCSALLKGQSIPKSLLGQNSTRAVLKSGQYAIFDSRLAHESGENRSPRRRTGLTMVFAAANISLGPYAYDGLDWRKPVLVRGSKSNVQTHLYEVSGFKVGNNYA